MTSDNFDFSKRGHIEFQFKRCPDRALVFAPMLKCASSYYNNLFTANHWQTCGFDSIDWQNDHVFGFLMDPFRRHIKGLVEDLLALGLENTLLNNVGWNFWKQAPVLGVHGLGPTQVYNTWSHKINWIPLDVNEILVNQVLDDLFKKFDTKIDWDLPAYAHKSSEYQNEFFEKIYKLSQGHGKSWYTATHEDDVRLYDRAVSIYSNAQ